MICLCNNYSHLYRPSCKQAHHEIPFTAGTILPYSTLNRRQAGVLPLRTCDKNDNRTNSTEIARPQARGTREQIDDTKVNHQQRHKIDYIFKKKVNIMGKPRKHCEIISLESETTAMSLAYNND